MFLLIAAFLAGAAVGVLAVVAGVKLMKMKTADLEAAAPVHLWYTERNILLCVCVGMFHCIVRYCEFLLIVM